MSEEHTPKVLTIKQVKQCLAGLPNYIEMQVSFDPESFEITITGAVDYSGSNLRKFMEYGVIIGRKLHPFGSEEDIEDFLEFVRRESAIDSIELPGRRAEREKRELENINSNSVESNE